MPETITKIWSWQNVKNDLVQQGGLCCADITVLPTNYLDFYVGDYRGEAFTVTWIPDRCLLLSSSVIHQALVNAFSKVIGYIPFCQYAYKDLLTVEWNKEDWMTQLAELRVKPGVTGNRRKAPCFSSGDIRRGFPPSSGGGKHRERGWGLEVMGVNA